MLSLRRHSFVLALGLLLFGAHPASGETVVLPITLDYPLLNSFIVSQSYTGPDKTAEVLNAADGCYRIELSEPDVSPEGDYLRIGSKIKVRMGVPVFGRCLEPVEWEGYVELVEQLWVNKQKWLLTFETVDSRLFDKDRKPKLASDLWDLVKTHVHPYFDKVALNLAPPVKELDVSLPLFFGVASRDRVTRWLKSLRPGTARVLPEAARVNILMDVETEAPAEEAPITLSPEEIQQFIQSWETWDAFLVYQILALGGGNLTDDERRTVLQTLLDTRYEFIREAIARTPGPDLVRKQFVRVWGELSPILRKHLLEDPARAPSSYLAFFTAADALAALDKLGSTLDIDVSRNGLLRLASLLAREGGPAPTLAYSTAVDAGLRTTLGMGAPLDESGPAFDKEELDIGAPATPAEPPAPPPSLGTRLRDWLIPRALAGTEAAEPSPDLSQLAPWLVPDNDPKPYLDRLKGTLVEGATKAIDGGKLDAQYQPLYRLLVTATAWQESCWRQFVQQGGKITYLRSYNNTSVGLMQINERVWRGIYNPASLRWNVPYNARAGAEIIEQYLSRFALARIRAGKALHPDLIARGAYAMYNSGPGDFDNFLRRNETRSLRETDRLFEEKYTWVKSEQWDQIRGCLPGF